MGRGSVERIDPHVFDKHKYINAVFVEYEASAVEVSVHWDIRESEADVPNVENLIAKLPGHRLKDSIPHGLSKETCQEVECLGKRDGQRRQRL